MKLLNYTTSWFALILFLILSVWAGIFYLDMLDEIYDSIDDGLENQKLLVIQKAANDPKVLERAEFEDGYYKIKEINAQEAKGFTDTYQDTLMYMQNEKDFEPVRMLKTVFRQNERYYQMSVITSMVEEDDLVEHLLFALILLYLGLLASTVLLNNFLLKKIWQPFYRLLERLKTFNLDKPKPIEHMETSINEFGLLNDTIQKLLLSNIKTYNSQKQFIENAAHELQTPLAISLNKLELLVENHPLEEEEILLVSSVMDNLQRLTRLNKSLLLLSRINNKQFTAESEVDLNQLALKLKDDFSDFASHRDITIHYQESGKCIPKMNPDLAGILLTNLIKNALIHNYSGGFVTIAVHNNRLIIENSGQPSPLDQARSFERFHKEGASGNSTGLGLAISKAITDLYHFSIQYDYQEKHIFQIIF